MSEIIDQFYTPLLIEHGFIRDPDNQQYGALGDCWKLSPEVGEGTYWTYGQKDLYDIKIHNFSFHEDFMLECSMPECLSITRYDSISGEELSPYRRLSAGCIKTFIGGYTPYKALIHKNIPIRSVGIEIAPAYYEDYLKTAHHGSRYSTGAEFLEIVRPELAVVSCSATNTYGHPSPDTLERLKKSGSRVLITRDCGAVTIVNGKSVSAFNRIK